VADKPATVDGDAALAERYEQLRQVVLGGQAEGWRHGLGVLANKGMAGWMAAWNTTFAPHSPTPALTGHGVTTMGAGTAEIVHVMAAMALAHT
jgi:hypothetical protein